MSVPAPLPRIAAFEKLGFGIFVHWGLYAQGGRGEWSQRIHKIPSEEYVKWMDDGEDGIYMQDTAKKLLTVQCDPFPYGTDLVVNVLKIETR